MIRYNQNVPEATGTTPATMGTSTLGLPRKQFGFVMEAGGPVGIKFDGAPMFQISDGDQVWIPQGFQNVAFFNARIGETGPTDRKLRFYTLDSDETAVISARPPQPDVIAALDDLTMNAGVGSTYAASHMPNPSYFEFLLCANLSNANAVRISGYTIGNGSTDRASATRGILLYPGEQLRMPAHCGLYGWNPGGAACTVSVSVMRSRVLHILGQ